MAAESTCLAGDSSLSLLLSARSAPPETDHSCVICTKMRRNHRLGG